MTHITGRQARQLLDGTTPGPWEFFHDEWGHSNGDEARFEQWGVIGGSDGIMSSSPRDSLFDADNGLVDEHDHAANLTLAAAAPDLAETIAWLYGAEMTTDSWGDVEWHRHGADGNLTLETDRYVEVETFLGDEEGPLVCVTTGPYGETVKLNADEAVEMARALLAAAQEARIAANVERIDD